VFYVAAELAGFNCYLSLSHRGAISLCLYPPPSHSFHLSIKYENYANYAALLDLFVAFTNTCACVSVGFFPLFTVLSNSHRDIHVVFAGKMRERGQIIGVLVEREGRQGAKETACVRWLLGSREMIYALRLRPTTLMRQ